MSTNNLSAFHSAFGSLMIREFVLWAGRLIIFMPGSNLTSQISESVKREVEATKVLFYSCRYLLNLYNVISISGEG